MKRIFVLGFFLISLGISCTDQTEKRFSRVTSSDTGVQFSNTLVDTPELNILNYLYYYNGAGVLAADFNNDNAVDLYFVGNQIADELYLNQGDFKFKKIGSSILGIENSTGWSTGATQVDINDDGLLDIYICKASGYRSLNGKNLLYINQGINEEGIPTFKEKAAEYGLDFQGLSTHAAFFDYDLDGDLDMYLLNHSVHPNRNYGRGRQRQIFDAISGDRLYQNTNGHFEDISAKAGIFQGKSGYGLGISISDINNDGYPDIYIGNDFFENDYLYINQKNGTYKEIISNNSEQLGHTTHFSMGSDIADINNDGLMDIISLDMLPENLETYKTSGLEYPYPIYRQYLNQGFSPQFMQNTLHLNLGNETFSEIAHLSGLSATEWSWGSLLADFDNDGYNDLFVSNGIKGATNDMDFMNFIANESIQRRIDNGMTNSDMPLVEELPEKKVPNYFFRNNGNLSFENTTENWLDTEPSFSNGCTYADLDNDGDLDVIVNNIDQKAYLLRNNSENGNYLKVKFIGKNGNRNGIGAKVMLNTNTKSISREHFTSKGYLSSKSNTIHFGLGTDSTIDSLKVIWPDSTFEIILNISANQQITLNQSNATGSHTFEQNQNQIFSKTDSLVNYTHKEQVSIDFDREPLIPFAGSNQGPSISVTDINQDNLEDLFISGGKRQASALYVQQNDGSFENSQADVFTQHQLHEDVTSVFFDSDGDGDNDLLIASGGNEFTKGKPLEPRMYINENGKFKYYEPTFENTSINASKIVPFDFDNDGDMDIFITSNLEPSQFGKTPQQYLFENDGKGNFSDVTKDIAPEFQYLGNVRDLISADFNADGLLDFIAVGHWIPISIFLNTGSKFKLQNYQSLSNTNGWWNSIKVHDFDNDGDLDIIAGNWGANTKFKASLKYPISLYRADFDENGSIEPLITYFHQGIETPFASKDELVKQMPYLNKEFLSYKSFANASMQDLFGKTKLKNADRKKVYELESCYFENTGNGEFHKKPLPKIAQSSSIYDMAIEDIDNDGFDDVLIIGNDFEISTQLGRLDALHGVLLQNDKNGGFYWNKTQTLNINGAARTIEKINVNGADYYAIGINNSAPVFLTKRKRSKKK